MRVLRTMTHAGLMVMALGCAPGGGGGGGGGFDDGLPWADCVETEGEAPCCPRVDVEAWCEGGTFVEAVGPAHSCSTTDGQFLLVAGAEGNDFVSSVVSADARLGWQGSMRCGEDGRVIAFLADQPDQPDAGRCSAACFYDYLTEPGPCALAEPECPELNPFPLSQPLRARCDGDMGCGP